MITNYDDFARQFNIDVDFCDLNPEKVAHLTFELTHLYHDALMNVIDLKERVRVMTAIASFLIAVSALTNEMNPYFKSDNHEPMTEEDRKIYN